MDLTSFARGIGYTGKRPVITIDGKVISHGRVCWFEWCSKTQARAKRRKRTLP